MSDGRRCVATDQIIQVELAQDVMGLRPLRPLLDGEDQFTAGFACRPGLARRRRGVLGVIGRCRLGWLLGAGVLAGARLVPGRWRDAGVGGFIRAAGAARRGEEETRKNRCYPSLFHVPETTPSMS